MRYQHRWKGIRVPFHERPKVPCFEEFLRFSPTIRHVSPVERKPLDFYLSSYPPPQLGPVLDYTIQPVLAEVLRKFSGDAAPHRGLVHVLDGALDNTCHL